MYRLQQQEAVSLLKIVNNLGQVDDTHALRESIAEDVLRLLRADYLASFVWNDATQRFEDAVSCNMNRDNLVRYEGYFQFHDPITHLLQQRRNATLVRQVMPQKELEKTEFYNDFLQKDGLHTGINVYAYDGERNIGDLRVWRHKGRPEFEAREVTLLELLKPHFV